MTTQPNNTNEVRASIENPDTPLSDPAAWLIDMLGAPTVTGVQVNEQSALSFSAVWACIRIISETLAMLPVHLYERIEDGERSRRKLVSGHPGFRLIHIAPNPDMIPMVFRETLQAHLLGYGNAYALIRRRNDMTPVALEPLLPDRTAPYRSPSGRIVYRTKLESGEDRVLQSHQVLHIPGLGFDGLVGVSPLRKHRESIGLGLAAQEYAARLFGDGTHLSGVLEHPTKLAEGQPEKLAQQWKNFRAGLKNAHGIAVLENGMKYHAIGIPPEDAQMLETRKFQITDIARIFRVPPHMLADLERATFSNIEHLSIEFVKYTMMPWLVRWEQELNRKLLTEDEKANHYFKFNVDGLLRGDIKSRYEAYHIAWMDGWMSQNDIREKEDHNPIEGGDEYYVPQNMQPTSQLDESIDDDELDSADSESQQNGLNDDDFRVIRNREARFLKRLARRRLNAEKIEREVDRFVQAQRQAVIKRGATCDQVEAYISHLTHRMDNVGPIWIRRMADQWEDMYELNVYRGIFNGH